MELLRVISSLAAEPASFIYIATGTAGLLIARLRPGRRPSSSSVAMLFCRRSSRETVARVDLLRQEVAGE